jgi:hypothetical protein
MGRSFSAAVVSVDGGRPGSGHYLGQRNLSGLHLSEQALHLCVHLVIPDR